MPLKEIQGPQGKALKWGLAKPGLKEVQDVGIGKHVQLELESSSREEVCKKLLANLIREGYAYTIHQA